MYGVRVLLEAGLGIGLLTRKDGVYRLTTTGWYILKDGMTIANMDFSHDVCFEGMFSLDESIRTGKPEGLHVFGEWSTVYQGLAQLPAHVQKSWFAFDHYYSDDAYPLVIPMIARYKPTSVLDIGGNTGKFALQLLRADPDIPRRHRRPSARRESGAGLDHATGIRRSRDVPSGRHVGSHTHSAKWLQRDLDATHTLPNGFSAI